MELERHTSVTLGSNRSFGLTFAILFGCIAVWPLITGSAKVSVWAVLLSLFFLIPALTYPRALSPFNYAWFTFGCLLGRVATPIVMTLIYVTLMIPFALASRLLGTNTLNLKFDPQADSYWIQKRSSFSMQKTF